jgi:hypothetical protein
MFLEVLVPVNGNASSYTPLTTLPVTERNDLEFKSMVKTTFLNTGIR